MTLKYPWEMSLSWRAALSAEGPGRSLHRIQSLRTGSPSRWFQYTRGKKSQLRVQIRWFPVLCGRFNNKKTWLIIVFTFLKGWFSIWSAVHSQRKRPQHIVTHVRVPLKPPLQSPVWSEFLQNEKKPKRKKCNRSDGRIP